ncbi:MAG TPA: hypothetical protein VEK15_06275 [Vicinamibacteria bacterium]|nr:hypothetical protein [Vicinamibacteria bacterium]
MINASIDLRLPSITHDFAELLHRIRRELPFLDEQSWRTVYGYPLAERRSDEAERLFEEALASARRELADGSECPNVAVEIAA